MTQRALPWTKKSERSTLPEEHLHRARWRESSSGVRLRRHRSWSILLVAFVVFGFGSWRLIGDDPGESSSAVGVQQPGVRSAVRIAADGALHIVQRLTFTKARSSLTVSIPIRSAPDNLFDPRIDDLRIRVDAQNSAGLTARLRKGETFTFRLPARSTTAELVYSVNGATDRSLPSAPGRALVLATPLAIAGTASLPLQIVVDGSGVLNVGCKAPGDTLSTCGTETSRGWLVERGANDPVDVLAQVDLPAQNQP